MNILFDHQAFSLQSHGGISRYYCELASRLQHLGCAVEIVAPLHSNDHLRALGGVKIVGQYIPRIRYTMTARRRLNDTLSTLLIRRRPKIDLVHETYYSASRSDSLSTKRVVTVYDMIHEKFPSDFDPRDPTCLNKARAVQRADHVICISENTRQDLITLLNVAPEKTSVTYLASDFAEHALETTETPIASKPYIAYVGMRRGYKNFLLLLDAVAGSEPIRKEFDIVCFGGSAFTQAELEMVKRLGLQEKVHQRGGGDSALRAHYKNASIFVYPSAYEGFGIPPLEAMAMGCPVVCSNTGSLPEVVGDAAELFDPSDPSQLAWAIERALGQERRDELVRRGKERIKRFSWDNCARETLAIYQRISDISG